MRTQAQRQWIFGRAICRCIRSPTTSLRWSLAIALLLFLHWLPAGEVTEKQWKTCWRGATTVLQEGFIDSGTRGLVRQLVWPKRIPANQPALWARHKQLLGISQAAAIKRFGKPLRDFRDCDENLFLVYPDGIVILHYDDKRRGYRVTGWTPRASNFEKYLSEGGC